MSIFSETRRFWSDWNQLSGFFCFLSHLQSNTLSTRVIFFSRPCNVGSMIFRNGQPFVVTNSTQAFMTASPVMFTLTPALPCCGCRSFVRFISLPVRNLRTCSLPDPCEDLLHDGFSRTSMTASPGRWCLCTWRSKLAACCPYNLVWQSPICHTDCSFSTSNLKCLRTGRLLKRPIFGNSSAGCTQKWIREKLVTVRLPL